LVRRSQEGPPYQPRMTVEYREFGEMAIGRRNLSARRKPAPVPFCLSQISHDLIWDRTRVIEVRGWPPKPPEVA
jgi:hypothetical protein